MVSAHCGPWNLLLNHQGRRHANGNRERETEEEASMIDEESRDKSAWRLDKKRRPAFSGIIVDGGGPGWLDGDSVESAKWRPYLVAIHVCEDSGVVLFSTAACRATVRLNAYDKASE